MRSSARGTAPALAPGYDPMTLNGLERLIREATDPRDIFGDDVEGNLEAFRALSWRSATCPTFIGPPPTGARAGPAG